METSSHRLQFPSHPAINLHCYEGNFDRRIFSKWRVISQAFSTHESWSAFKKLLFIILVTFSTTKTSDDTHFAEINYSSARLLFSKLHFLWHSRPIQMQMHLSRIIIALEKFIIVADVKHAKLGRSFLRSNYAREVIEWTTNVFLTSANN